MGSEQRYDYIVVGGGTAGLVVANRLSEDPEIHVLVLEAGRNRNQESRITTPGLAPANLNDPDYDWNFTSTPQPQLDGKQIDLPRGKLIGGSSAINVFALIYPHRSTIDAWEKDLGNEGWGFDDLAPYYRKAITTQEPSDETAKALSTDYLDKRLHGSGPLQSSFPRFYGPLGTAWNETFKNLNLSTTTDPRSGEGYGAFTSLATIDGKTATRSHSGSAYYDPVASRPNMHLITEALVEKIVLKKEADGEAVACGVQFTRDGQSNLVSAAREVILSAGAFQSPQILELSGVGNPEILSKHGIETIVDNSYVGENLQDHPMTGLCFEANDNVETLDKFRDPVFAQEAMKIYDEKRSGPLSSGFHSAALLPVREFAATDEGRAELKHLLDTQLDFLTEHTKKLPSIHRQYAVHRASLENPSEGSILVGMSAVQMHAEKATHKEIFALSDPGSFVVVVASLTSPLSRGSVHLSSSDPAAPPDIDVQYLAHPLDLEVHARQLRFVPELAATAPLSDFLKPGGRRLPAKQDLSSLDAAKEHLRRHVFSNNHACGSCPMMPRDLGGVVDTKLRVYGAKNLRVVDASVFPMMPKGNIQSTVYAVAEKAADIIKQG